MHPNMGMPMGVAVVTAPACSLTGRPPPAVEQGVWNEAATELVVPLWLCSEESGLEQRPSWSCCCAIVVCEFGLSREKRKKRVCCLLTIELLGYR